MKLFLRSITVILFIVFSGLIHAQSYTQQGDKLVGTGAIGYIHQGKSVAISADGNTAIVGGPLDSDRLGAAWIYIKENGVWQQQGNKLVGTWATEHAEMGSTVSISGDGNTAIIGGVNDAKDGVAWIFVRENGIWKQQGNKLVGPGYRGYNYCPFRSVCISGDGNTVILGDPMDWSTPEKPGSAKIFIRQNGVWSQQGENLFGTGSSIIWPAYQGYSVSLSADGNTAIVGGPEDDKDLGAAWIYVRENGIWTQQGNKLVGTGAVGDARQGYSVAISADGNTAIVGGPEDDKCRGASWIFVRNNGKWTQQGNKLVGKGTYSYTYQAKSVSISADGNTVLIGGQDILNNALGKEITVSIFKRNNGIWTQKENIITLTGTDSHWYRKTDCSVSISGDGNTALIGRYDDDNDHGAAWIITNENGTWTQQGNKLVGKETAGNIFQGDAVAISSDGNTAAIGGYKNDWWGGAVWIFTRWNDTWKQQGDKLVNNNPDSYECLGSSVAISADGNTVAAGMRMWMGDKTQAAVLIYSRENGKWMQYPQTLYERCKVEDLEQECSVAISADGNTVVLGEPDDDYGKGSLWIFVKENGKWNQQGNKLTEADTELNASLGLSAAISADGNTIIAGSYGNNSFGVAAWIFVRKNGVWSLQEKKLISTQGDFDLEVSVAISADGNTAIIGNGQENSRQGAAWVYIRENGKWTQQGDKLVGTSAVGQACQGHSVAISADGNTAVIGGGWDNNSLVKDSIYIMGATWVFTRKNGVWTQSGEKLVGTGSSGGAMQGHAVSVSGNGNTILVGGPWNDATMGAAWVFVRSDFLIPSISGKITLNSNDPNGKDLCKEKLKNIKLFLWDKTGLPYNAFPSPALTDSLGNYSFKDVPLKDSLQVYLMEPLGFEADMNPKIIHVDANNAELKHVDFTLRKTLKENKAQSSYYWTEQFSYYALGKHGTPPSESEHQIMNYIKEIHEHYSPYFSLFKSLSSIDDWYSVFYYASRYRNYDYTSKAELAAFVLNIVSLKLPQYYIVTEDNRTAGECLGFISELAMMDERAFTASVYYICFRINTRQMIPQGVIKESSILFKSNIPDNLAEDLNLPTEYKLYTNYPNPFNPVTNIEFDIASQSYVSLVIYDINGREIERLTDKMMQPGHYRLQWNAAKYPSGMYLCRIIAGEYTDTKKLMLVK